MPRQQFFDNNGLPLAGGLVFTYLAGTSTPEPTFPSSQLGPANSNPVVLDSSGSAFIWLLPGISYRFVVESAASQLEWTADNVLLGVPNGAGGNPTQVQFNCGGALCGDPGMTYTLATQTFGAVNLTVTNTLGVLGNIQTPNLNNILYVSGASCSGAGISSAISALPSGGVIDATGCTGSFTGGAWTSTVPIVIYLGASSWAMGSSTITLGNGSKLIGLGHQATILTWTGDVDGIATPAGTTGGNVTVRGISLVNGSLSSASRAVLHFIDCPYCRADDVFVSFDSTAASAGIRVEAVTANSGYGTWSGKILWSTVQRTAANQGTRATSGQIDVDFKGNSGVTNGNISRWTLLGNHLEGGTIDFQVFCGSANKIYAGDMFSGAPSVNITGNGSCNSNSNYIDTELNGVSLAGSKAFAIDAFSNFNTIAGDISQNLVAPTDAGAENVKWYSTNTLGTGAYSVPQLSAGKLSVTGGAAADGGGFKHKRFGATCTTGSTIGNTCTTTFSWTTAFADANYTPVCTPVGPTQLGIFSINSFNAAGVTILIDTATNAAASYSGVDCVAVHD